MELAVSPNCEKVGCTSRSYSLLVELFVEIHSTLNWQVPVHWGFRWRCSVNFERLIRLTLNYPCLGSRNSELSRRKHLEGLACLPRQAV